MSQNNDRIAGLLATLESLRGWRDCLRAGSTERQLLNKAADDISRAIEILRREDEASEAPPALPVEQQSSRLTTDRNDPRLQQPPVPGKQNDVYLVLSEEERAKGFVRPIRSRYRHVGPPGPKFPLVELSEEEKRRHKADGYTHFEKYPDDYPSGLFGRYWTQERLAKVDKGCGTVTTMGRALCETYAREPHFYGATFCVGCGVHLPVGEQGEFVWEDDGERVGT